VHGDAVSNNSLNATFALGVERCASLEALGWNAPGDGPDEEDDNYWVLHELPEDADFVAEQIVTTLRAVYGVPAPSFLVDDASGGEGSLAGEARPFGLTWATPTDRRPAGPDRAVPSDSEDLRDLVAVALEPILGATSGGSRASATS